jgi:hypothetical protein
MSVLPGQLKSIGNLVHICLKEGQNGSESAGSVSALVVMVVDENERVQCVQLVPSLAIVA